MPDTIYESLILNTERACLDILYQRIKIFTSFSLITPHCFSNYSWHVMHFFLLCSLRLLIILVIGYIMNTLLLLSCTKQILKSISSIIFQFLSSIWFHKYTVCFILNRTMMENILTEIINFKHSRYSSLVWKRKKQPYITNILGSSATQPLGDE